MIFPVHLLNSASSDYTVIPLPLSICKFPKTIFYWLLCAVGHCVLHQVVIGIDTIHPQVVPLLEDRPLV